MYVNDKKEDFSEFYLNSENEEDDKKELEESNRISADGACICSCDWSYDG